jgi:hypothetical protein
MNDKHVYMGEESVPAIIWAHALAPGKCVWRGKRDGTLIDAEGAPIGSYYRSPTGRGWSIWTKAYAGFAYESELEIMP